MTILPIVLWLALCGGFVALTGHRAVVEARPRGGMLYRGLQTGLTLAAVGLLCWQMFAIGFQAGGDIARRDARAEARAAARA